MQSMVLEEVTLKKEIMLLQECTIYLLINTMREECTIYLLINTITEMQSTGKVFMFITFPDNNVHSYRISTIRFYTIRVYFW